MLCDRTDWGHRFKEQSPQQGGGRGWQGEAVLAVWGLKASPHPTSSPTCGAGAMCSCLPGRASQEFGSSAGGPGCLPCPLTRRDDTNPPLFLLSPRRGQGDAGAASRAAIKPLVCHDAIDLSSCWHSHGGDTRVGAGVPQSPRSHPGPGVAVLQLPGVHTSVTSLAGSQQEVVGSDGDRTRVSQQIPRARAAAGR